MHTDPSDVRTLAGLLHNVAAHGLASLLPIPAAEIIAMETETEKAFHEQWSRERILTEPRRTAVGLEGIDQWGISRWMQVASEFLLSPEMEEIVRQIYALQPLMISSNNDSASPRTTFAILLGHFATLLSQVFDERNRDVP